MVASVIHSDAPATPSMAPAARSRRRFRSPMRVAAVPFFAGLTLFAFYPFLCVVALSLSRSTLGSPFQSWTGALNFLNAVKDPLFVGALMRSVGYAATTTLLSILLGTAIALLLGSFVRGQELLRTIILLPLLTPPVTVGILWQLLLTPEGGWANSILLDIGAIATPVTFLGSPLWAFPAICLADIWQWTPFIALMVYATLQTLPQDVIDAARIDGATSLQIFRYVTLPMILPATLGVAVLKLIIGFRVFDLIFVLTGGGPGQATTLASYYIYRVAVRQFDIGFAAAETIIFAAVVTLITIPFSKAQTVAEKRLS
jgi:multiple sugar transport system permease protein